MPSLFTALAVALPSAFYTLFIARTSFSFEGRTFYTLFDDAMISMRYGRNLADGHGLDWNVGQHVEGYSNFLWTVAMGAAHLLGLPDSRTSLVIMAAGAALLVGSVLVVGRLCRELAPESRTAPAVAMALTAFFYPLVFWTLRGMEVGLAALLVLLGALLAIRLVERGDTRARWWLAATLAAAVLTRDDLLIPAAVTIAYVAWRVPAETRRRTLAVLCGSLAAAVAAHTAFRLAYYGTALPNTYYLKLDGIAGSTRFERGSTAVAYTWLTDLYAPLLLAAAFFAARRRAVPRGALLLAAVFLSQTAYAVYVGGDAWENLRHADRYLATVAPLVFVLAALGVDDLVRNAASRVRVALAVAAGMLVVALLQLKDWLPVHLIGLAKSSGVQHLRPALAIAVACAVVGVVVAASARRRDWGGWRVGVAAAAIGLVVLVAVNAVPGRDWLRWNSSDRPESLGWARTGLILRELTPPGTSVAMVAAGNTAYFDHRPGVDMLGKMDPHIAHLPPKPADFRPGHSKWDYAFSIGRLRPAVIAQLWAPTDSDLCRLRSWGYRALGPQLYVRDDAAGPRSDTLGKRVAGLHFLNPIPWPSACAPGAGHA